jgi:hypothetical protein
MRDGSLDWFSVQNSVGGPASAGKPPIKRITNIRRGIRHVLHRELDWVLSFGHGSSLLDTFHQRALDNLDFGLKALLSKPPFSQFCNVLGQFLEFSLPFHEKLPEKIFLLV